MTKQIDDLENILEKLDKSIFEMVDIREHLAKHYHGDKTWNYGIVNFDPMFSGRRAALRERGREQELQTRLSE